ncbi:hypothetical protein MKX01_015657 [Papaver californicum]|nr:hypothetical protein MKX01_015657 [Papaver californicum]
METRILICLVMSILVLTDMSEVVIAATFTSKLIHRFSDEMKEFRVSINGRDKMLSSWPRRKSVDYYQLLVGNDFQRQNMKLGAEYQFLFPSQGSKTISFGDDFGWLHYTWIDIGTPNVSFLVALDAGSDLLWVPCDCIECAPLSASHYNSLDRDLSEYSPSESSTSKHVSCSNELCDLGSNCKNTKQPCPYIANYYSDNTSSSGLLVEDTLHLASSSSHASKSLVQAPVIIGCGRKQSGVYLDGVAPDGVMGLGLGDISILSSLAKAGLAPNSFSMCFDDDDSGRIFFGDKGPASQKSTSFLPLDGKIDAYMVGVEGCCIGSSCLEQTKFQAQVDSGTSFTFLPKKVYGEVVAEFDKKINTKRSSYDGSPWEYCYETSSEGLHKIPTLSLMFLHNNSFEVHNPVFLIYENEEVTGFCLAIQPSAVNYGIIGQNFMTGYRVVFDREKLNLHWSRSNCQDLSKEEGIPDQDKPENPLPTTEQQSTGGGKHAVAPAVAGRTTTNPSTASRRFMSKLQLPAQLSLLLLVTSLLRSVI